MNELKLKLFKKLKSLKEHENSITNYLTVGICSIQIDCLIEFMVLAEIFDEYSDWCENGNEN